MSNPLDSEGGPPDPILFLRKVAVDQSTHGIDASLLSKLDSAEAAATQPDSASKRRQDPPARERPSNGEPWPYRDNLSFTRSLIFYGEGAVTEENERACQFIQEARALRQKYFGGSCDCIVDSSVLESDGVTFAVGNDGVVELFHPNHHGESLCTVPAIDDFYVDYKRLVEIVSDGAMRSYCFQRLQLLSSAFKMHVTANGAVESKEQRQLLGTDFYRTMKIDNHIHAAAAPSAKQFVNFVRNKLETEANMEVCPGKTLAQVFTEAGLDTEHLTIDAFNVLADYTVYQRFDNFNSKYSPFRMADMRRIFLKTTNYMGGRYFAELIKIVLSRHEESKGHNSAAEMRLSIYGMERHEWLDLAKWVLNDWEGGDFPGPVLSSHNRWLVQVPRLWRIYRNKPGEGERSFQEMLDNLFIPMFEATLYPEEHPEVAELLKNIVGIDSVDDEGTNEVSDSL